MGWTWTTAGHYRNGTVDRKAECDDLFNWERSEEHKNDSVLKSAMVGSTYYAALRVERPGEEDKIVAVVCLTSTRMNDRAYNFGYKEMDETMLGKGCYAKCPKTILKLLTPTDNETANEWRQSCWEYHALKQRVPAYATRVRATFKRPISWNGYTLEAGEPAVFCKTRDYPGGNTQWLLEGTRKRLRSGEIHKAVTIEVLTNKP